jgi:8-oxo-dGTP diphosphatase
MAYRGCRRTVAAQDEFPDRPLPAVGAIVFREERILLVKRAEEPDAGGWSLPGGVLEVGETVESAVVRETLEETQVQVRPGGVFEVGDFIRTAGGQARWHYVLIDLLCDYVDGEPMAGTDAANARWIPLAELAEYDIVESALDVLRRASASRR